MSWLFGFKPQQPSYPVDVPNPQSNAPTGNDDRGRQQRQPQQGKEGDKVGSQMAYSFDSTALERAAQAAKTLEMSSNAKQALELSRLQEMTKQKEYELQQKVFYIIFDYKIDDLFSKLKHGWPQCKPRIFEWPRKSAERHWWRKRNMQER